MWKAQYCKAMLAGAEVCVWLSGKVYGWEDIKLAHTLAFYINYVELIAYKIPMNYNFIIELALHTEFYRTHELYRLNCTQNSI